MIFLWMQTLLQRRGQVVASRPSDFLSRKSKLPCCSNVRAKEGKPSRHPAGFTLFIKLLLYGCRSEAFELRPFSCPVITRRNATSRLLAVGSTTDGFRPGSAFVLAVMRSALCPPAGATCEFISK
jgi:hypothetical protein